jgi:hypothetical protein
MLEGTFVATIIALLVVVLIANRPQWARSHGWRNYRLLRSFPAVSQSVKVPLSVRQVQLEVLLTDLRSISEVLSAALDAEAQFGEEALAAQTTDAESAVARWLQSRSNVECAQSKYTQAVRDYQQFVEQLPPPLRIGASERGTRAMELQHS